MIKCNLTILTLIVTISYKYTACICKNETKCDTSTGLCIVCSPHTYKHSKADCKPCPPQCNASDITTGNCNLQGQYDSVP